MAQNTARPAGKPDLGLCPLLIICLPPSSSVPNLAKTLSRNLSIYQNRSPSLRQPSSFPAQRGGGCCYSGSLVRSEPSLRAPQWPEEPQKHRAWLPYLYTFFNTLPWQGSQNGSVKHVPQNQNIKQKECVSFLTASVDLTNSVPYGLASSLRYLKTEVLDHVVV